MHLHRFQGSDGVGRLPGAAVQAAERREKSAESETDPETRDDEALIKRATGTALHRETT